MTGGCAGCRGVVGWMVDGLFLFIVVDRITTHDSHPPLRRRKYNVHRDLGSSQLIALDPLFPSLTVFSLVAPSLISAHFCLNFYHQKFNSSAVGSGEYISMK
mmetsp:Transcript_5045/g.9857  ORF Transcript_5045/g.9857 Transcript_5045/m.9857 type:complete len:102 (-) Transcript_5045:660-965(-)